MKSHDRIVNKIKYTVIIDATITIGLITRIFYKYSR